MTMAFTTSCFHTLESSTPSTISKSVQISTPWRRMLIKFMSLGETDLCRVFYIAADSNMSSLPSASPALSQLQLLMRSPAGGAGKLFGIEARQYWSGFDLGAAGHISQAV